MIFRYKYRDQDGSIKVGRTTGDNPDQARSKLARLQITPLSVWLDGEKEPPMKDAPVPEWLKDAVTPPKPKEDEPVVLSEDEEKRLMEKRELEVKPDFGPPPELLQEAAEFEKQRAASNLAVAPMVKPDFVTRGQVDRVSVRRRQTFLVDDKEKAEARINDLLARKGGKVVIVTMTPDARGKVLIAAVVEHEE